MSAWSIRGKTCLITGATQGIGAAAARELARRGARIVIIGRDRARGEAIVQRIRAETGGADVALILADLSAQREVRRAAAEARAMCGRLDVLMNNAGAIFMRRQLTEDGLEQTFALNHLAYFLLTHLLLDLMKGSAPARIINVASNAHWRGAMRFDDLMGERRYSGMRAYADSKLANVLFTYELARRLEGSGVSANCLHPGVVATGFGLGTPGLFRHVVRLAQPFMLTPEQGARTLVHLAAAPEVEGLSGRYFDKCQAVPSSRASYDREAQRRLFEESERLTALRE